MVLHQESKTFNHRTAAQRWAKHREVALEDPAALVRVQHGTPTVAELIRWYIDTFETVARWQRCKQTHLEFLERHALGKADAVKLTSGELIRHVQARRADGAGPATVINDLIWIGVVPRAAVHGNHVVINGSREAILHTCQNSPKPNSRSPSIDAGRDHRLDQVAERRQFALTPAKRNMSD